VVADVERRHHQRCEPVVQTLTIPPETQLTVSASGRVGYVDPSPSLTPFVIQWRWRTGSTTTTTFAIT
jgi:hypothetical protein